MCLSFTGNFLNVQYSGATMPRKNLSETWENVYRNVLEFEKIRLKKSEFWRDNSWFFHHDHAPADSVLSNRQFCVKNRMTVLPQPPYLPNLALCDFFLFGRIKTLPFSKYWWQQSKFITHLKSHLKWICLELLREMKTPLGKVYQ